MLKKLLPACILVFSACLPFFAQSQSQGIFNLRPIDIVVEGAKANITSQLNFWSQFTTKPDTTVGGIQGIGKNLQQTFGKALETFLPFQFKYAIMLNESVEKLTNLGLYATIDNWYGTRYRYGGTSSRGIDCSAFMQKLAAYAFGLSLPRTAKEQFKSSVQISKSDLKEGDLVFFNTTGGVSHVGMYLQNNKFVHSASSKGVMISDLSDKFWTKHFIGAARVLID